MEATKDLVTKRREAYDFIVRKAKLTNWSPPINSDKALADALDIDVTELISLKEGRENPTQRLIERVRAVFASDRA